LAKKVVLYMESIRGSLALTNSPVNWAKPMVQRALSFSTLVPTEAQSLTTNRTVQSQQLRTRSTITPAAALRPRIAAATDK
jgi:hypothetical protein